MNFIRFRFVMIVQTYINTDDIHTILYKLIFIGLRFKLFVVWVCGSNRIPYEFHFPLIYSILFYFIFARTSKGVNGISKDIINFVNCFIGLWPFYFIFPFLEMCVVCIKYAYLLNILLMLNSPYSYKPWNLFVCFDGVSIIFGQFHSNEFQFEPVSMLYGWCARRYLFHLIFHKYPDFIFCFSSYFVFSFIFICFTLMWAFLFESVNSRLKSFHFPAKTDRRHWMDKNECMFNVHRWLINFVANYFKRLSKIV